MIKNQEIKKLFDFLKDNEIDIFFNSLSNAARERLNSVAHFYNYFDLVVDKKATPLRAILMIFAIEAATFSKADMDFPKWLKEEDKETGRKYNQEEVCNLYKKYIDNESISGKFNKLFIEHLNAQEKIELIRSFSKSNPPNYNEIIHLCYKEDEGCCDYQECYLGRNTSDLDNALRKITSMFYRIRSSFVHGCEIQHFTYSPKDGYLNLLIGIYNNRPLEIKLSDDTFLNLSKKIIYRYHKAAKIIN